MSRLSFLTGSIKGKEGFVKKRHGDFRSGGGCRSVLSGLSSALTIISSMRWLCWRWPLTCCAQLPTQWGRRWLVVQDTALTYLNPETGRSRHSIAITYLEYFLPERFIHNFSVRSEETVYIKSKYIESVTGVRSNNLQFIKSSFLYLYP